jgi:hypothetical protein
MIIIEVIKLKFNRYLEKLAYYFKDSYGMDRLSKYLFIAGLILSLSRYTAIFSYVLIGYGAWRTFSKNKYKRYQELVLFEKVFSKQAFENFRKYKVFKCPKCSQKLRIPRKKGRVTITCKKCGNEFKGKS